ncbi:MAG: hypothetical protein ABJ242_07960 [Marinomonas sp.]
MNHTPYDPTKPLGPQPSRGPHIYEEGGQTDEDFARGWLAHVHAGRIGKGPGTTPAQRLTHARNELLLCGRIL